MRLRFLEQGGSLSASNRQAILPPWDMEAYCLSRRMFLPKAIQVLVENP
jgi:hypothetical protein